MICWEVTVLKLLCYTQPQEGETENAEEVLQWNKQTRWLSYGVLPRNDLNIFLAYLFPVSLN